MSSLSGLSLFSSRAFLERRCVAGPFLGRRCMGVPFLRCRALVGQNSQQCLFKRLGCVLLGVLSGREWARKGPTALNEFLLPELLPKDQKGL